jgi:hypothetical protein
MRHIHLLTYSAIASLGVAMVGCGGGGGGDEEPAPPSLSGVQAAYESVALAGNGGMHNLLWKLPTSGAPSAGAGDFIVDIGSSGLANSPLTGGTQANSAAWTSLSSALALPTLPINLSVPTNNPVYIPTTGQTYRAPDRVVQNGAVLVVSSSPTTLQRVSYVGDNIRIDTLAVDGSTVAYGNLISMVNVVDVAAQPIAAASDGTLAMWLDREGLISNAAALLKTGATFAAGSSYLKFTATRVADTMFTGDCTLTQTTASTTPVPCQTGKTLGGTSQTTESNFADGTGGTAKVWNLATEGTICELAAQAAGTSCPPFGVRYWVATTSRTSTMNVPETTDAYRVFFEMGGNIYTGTLQRTGAQIRENLGSNAAPNVQPFYIRVNSTFVQSLQAALKF